MTTEKYRQLSQVHLLHRIWQSDLELASAEVDFWEDILSTLNEGVDPGVIESNLWRTEINQLHHFRRLINRLLEEIQTVNTEVAHGVQTGYVLDNEVRLDHAYLRMEMDSFHTDFRDFKTEIRNYMAAQAAS